MKLDWINLKIKKLHVVLIFVWIFKKTPPKSYHMQGMKVIGTYGTKRYALYLNMSFNN